MKLVPLNSLFDIKYGNQFDLYKLDASEESKINFVSRSSQNLGVVCKVSKYKNIEPYPAGIITVTLGGSYLLSSFVQQSPFYTAQNIKVLTPKKNMSFNERVFYCKCIEHNRFRYTSHGREANITLDTILAPAEMPNDFKKIILDKISVPSDDKLLQKQFDLNTKDWKSFIIEELFEIQKGERLVEYERIDGKMPLITATSENNGVSSFISYDDFHNYKRIFENKITVDMFCNVFFHNHKYFSDDNIHTLIPKYKNDNPYISLFIVTVLRQLKYKFNFGRQLRLSTINKEYIKLPSKNREPDFEFMEDYIKSLPYSSSL
jgi:hypothetical protein